MAHLGDTSGVICYRSVCVYRYGDTGGGKHSDCRKGYAVYAWAYVGDKYTDCYKKYRERRGKHSDWNSADDDSCRSCLWGFGDLLYRLIVAGGIYLGYLTYGKSYYESGYNGYTVGYAAHKYIWKDYRCYKYDSCRKIGSVI